MKKKEMIKFMDDLASEQHVESVSQPSSHDDATLEALWNLLPEKSNKLSEGDSEQCERFALLVSGYDVAIQNSNSEKNNPIPFASFRNPQPAWMLLILAACVVLTCTISGLGIWQYVETQNYRQEVIELKNWMAQSALDPRSSTERIDDIYLASSESNKLAPNSLLANQQLASAQIRELTATLRVDPSINVRFSVVQFLRAYIASPQVRAELLASIPYQTSRLVIIDIAQLYLSACSPAEMERLLYTLENSDLDPKWVRKLKQLEMGQI